MATKGWSYFDDPIKKIGGLVFLKEIYTEHFLRAVAEMMDFAILYGIEDGETLRVLFVINYAFTHIEESQPRLENCSTYDISRGNYS